ncbi:MAG: type II toxin-antitoxin system RelE/ParE family toxin [Lysobacter sp.]|nr:type II toxin-antitoxin system RelE/ParE family toxin [Lysobacter sp.]
MAVALVWSPEAIEDIEAIASYIERDSPWYANAVVSRIVETARSITENPRIGRVVPELGRKDVRERFVYSYRLIYGIEKTRVTVVAVIHGRRLLQPPAYRVSEDQRAEGMG